ncbi:putative Protein kinase domain containing protein [Blattamonas nauphoetae]|uniref:non-specific serine/threonine protein kinase n=1 Tax=Blattamonas nauphoetae TaxID=2049346 RepID=A0ABQ9Y6X2_9EUKA|nr:putative Protein kinase domain containing protein [Blattamonas nauphoetae]
MSLPRLPQKYKFTEGHLGERKTDLFLVEEVSTSKQFIMCIVEHKTPEHLEQLKKEETRMRSIRNERIVGLHDVDSDSSHHFFVFSKEELTLRQFLQESKRKQQSIPLHIAALICVDIADGLYALHHSSHHKKFTHGQLTVDRILLTADLRAKILFLNTINPRRETGEIHRSDSMKHFLHFSPERLCNDNSPPSPKDDIWALGLLFFELVSGSPLFSEMSYSSHCERIMAFDQPTFSPDLPAGIRALIRHLLDPDEYSRATITQICKGRLFEKALGEKTPLSEFKDEQMKRQQKPSSPDNSNASLQIRQLTNLIETQKAEIRRLEAELSGVLGQSAQPPRNFPPQPQQFVAPPQNITQPPPNLTQQLPNHMLAQSFQRAPGQLFQTPQPVPQSPSFASRNHPRPNSQPHPPPTNLLLPILQTDSRTPPMSRGRPKSADRTEICPLTNKPIIKAAFLKNEPDVLYEHDALLQYVTVNGMSPRTFATVVIDDIALKT